MRRDPDKGQVGETLPVRRPEPSDTDQQTRQRVDTGNSDRKNQGLHGAEAHKRPNSSISANPCRRKEAPLATPSGTESQGVVVPSESVASQAVAEFGFNRSQSGFVRE